MKKILIVIGTVTKGLVQELENLKNKRKSRDHPNYSIIEVSQITEKNPGDLKRLVVTQTPVKDHQVMLIGKTLKE